VAAPRFGPRCALYQLLQHRTGLGQEPSGGSSVAEKGILIHSGGQRSGRGGLHTPPNGGSSEDHSVFLTMHLPFTSTSRSVGLLHDSDYYGGGPPMNCYGPPLVTRLLRPAPSTTPGLQQASIRPATVYVEKFEGHTDTPDAGRNFLPDRGVLLRLPGREGCPTGGNRCSKSPGRLD